MIDAILNKPMFEDGDTAPRISQNITDRLMSRVILPALAALPTMKTSRCPARQPRTSFWSGRKA